MTYITRYEADRMSSLLDSLFLTGIDPVVLNPVDRWIRERTLDVFWFKKDDALIAEVSNLTLIIVEGKVLTYYAIKEGDYTHFDGNSRMILEDVKRMLVHNVDKYLREFV